jgi:hypothetical protein
MKKLGAAAGGAAPASNREFCPRNPCSITLRPALLPDSLAEPKSVDPFASLLKFK